VYFILLFINSIYYGRSGKAIKIQQMKSIMTDRHLPGIPSADEVKKNGVSIGDMQVKLLQKVEELTLHVIEQNRKLENLKTENETLKKQMAGLQSVKQ